MQGTWNVFQFLTRTLMTLCKPCLEESSNESNKICRLFARIPYNTISENTSKYDISDSKEDTDLGVPLQQIWMLQANKFSKKSSTKRLFRVLRIFSELTK